MKRLINKIIIKIGNYKTRRAKRKTKSFLRDEYFICRVCRRVLSREEMNPKDNSICSDCSKS